MICSADGKIFQLPCLILLWSWTIIKKILLETLNLTLWFHSQGFLSQIFQNHVWCETSQNVRDYSQCKPENWFRVHFGFSQKNLLNWTERPPSFRFVVIKTVTVSMVIKVNVCIYTSNAFQSAFFRTFFINENF